MHLVASSREEIAKWLSPVHQGVGIAREGLRTYERARYESAEARDKQLPA